MHEQKSTHWHARMDSRKGMARIDPLFSMELFIEISERERERERGGRGRERERI